MAFQTESRIKVRYAETDRMGVVYHANYLIWMEVGRTDFLAAVGFPYSKLEESGVLFPASDLSLRLIRPARYEEELRVLTSLACLQSRKVGFVYRIERGDQAIVSGTTEHICVDSRMRVRTIPSALYDTLKACLDGQKES